MMADEIIKDALAVWDASSKEDKQKYFLQLKNNMGSMEGEKRRAAEIVFKEISKRIDSGEMK